MVTADRYSVECEFTYSDLQIMHEALESLGEAARDSAPTDYETLAEYESDQEFGIRALALAMRIKRLLEPNH
jgi:hypothetical protein